MKKYLLLLIPVFIYWFNSDTRFINEANKLQNNLENINRYNLNEQIIIDKKYKIDNKTYNIRGKGVIFLEDNYSFFYEYDNKCIMKLPFEEDLMIQDEPCPIYRMFSGMKFKIANDENGLYEENNEYIFKGEGLNNFILLDNILYEIEKFNDKKMYLNNNKTILNEYKNINGTGSRLDPYIIIKEA